MHDDKLHRLVERLLTDHPEDLDCAVVVDIIARYVDLEVAGAAPGLDQPGIPIHLDLCPHCAEMYEALSQVAQLESRGALPDIETLLGELDALASGQDPTALPSMLEPAAGRSRWPGQQADGAPERRGTTAKPARGTGQPARRDGAVSWRPWSPRLQAVVPAALGCAALILGAAWWQARAEAARLDAELDQTAIRHHADMAEISRMSSDAFAAGADGAWTRVLFDPALARAVLFAGNLPPLGDGEWIECWFKKPDGRAALAGKFEAVERSLNYWTLAAGAPVHRDTTLVLMVEPAHHRLFEIPLVPDDGQQAAAAAPTVARR